MALCKLIEHLRHHDVIDAVLMLAENLHVHVLLFSLSSCLRFFVNVVIETNVNIRKELNFSDVY